MPPETVTQIEPLSGQKVFVLIGTEEGVAGVESFIKAAEQFAADDDAKKLTEMMAEKALRQKEDMAKMAEQHPVKLLLGLSQRSPTTSSCRMTWGPCAFSSWLAIAVLARRLP